MPTKAEVKQLNGAVNAFHSHYASASNWGDERWHNSLYPALSKSTRYALLVNQFADGTVLDNLLKAEIPPNELRQFQFPDIDGAGKLILYERNGNEEALFPAPTQDSTLLETHWNLDAASALTVHMLGVQPGDNVLDLCSAPGGKSVALAQLIFPQLHYGADPVQKLRGCLHSNEMDQPRNKRLAANLRSYFPRRLFDEGKVRVLQLDGSQVNAVTQLPLKAGGYDRVLVDAPCSSERHIIHAHEKAAKSGKIATEMIRWRPGSSRNLAKVQAALLLTALKALRVGGKAVYSTCSIETGENDGVLEKVLASLEKERKKFGLKWTIQFETGRKATKKRNDPILDNLTEETEYGRIALPDHSGGAFEQAL